MIPGCRKCGHATWWYGRETMPQHCLPPGFARQEFLAGGKVGGRMLSESKELRNARQPAEGFVALGSAAVEGELGFAVGCQKGAASPFQFLTVPTPGEAAPITAPEMIVVRLAVWCGGDLFEENLRPRHGAGLQLAPGHASHEEHSHAYGRGELRRSYEEVVHSKAPDRLAAIIRYLTHQRVAVGAACGPVSTVEFV